MSQRHGYDGTIGLRAQGQGVIEPIITTKNPRNQGLG